MVRQSDQEGALLLSNVSRPGNRRIRALNHLTLDFDDAVEAFESHHYAFHVSDAEFDAVLQRVQAAGLAFGSTPWSLDDAKLNDWNGGRGFYFKDLDGHILELMTVPQ